jgi:hypothetical protein
VARTVQVPWLSSASVVPATVHLVGVTDAYAIASPEPATPASRMVEPTNPDAGSENAIVWASGSGGATVTITDAVTSGAGVWPSSPACEAVTVQVPAALSARVVPSIEQMSGVDVA